MPELRLKRRAQTELTELPRAAMEAIDEALLRLQANPREIGYELRGRLRGTWATAVPVPGQPGGYRILYKLRNEDQSVIVESIRPRAEAYPQRS